MRPQPPHRSEATVTTVTTHGPLAWDCSFDPDSERVAMPPSLPWRAAQGNYTEDLESNQMLGGA